MIYVVVLFILCFGLVLFVIVVLGLADGGIPVWDLVPGPFMGNAWTTRRFPPGSSGLWVDSGGFQVLTRGLDVGVGDLIERYRVIRAEYYLSLDVPPKPGDEGSSSLLSINYRNFERLYGVVDWGRIVPVIHCYKPELLFEAVDYYRGYIGNGVIAFGGAVPGLLNRGLGRVATVILLSIARKVWRGWLHVLGAGSPVMGSIVGVIGADSADTATWRGKAAYGKVLLPGAGERHVGGRRIRYGPLYLSREEEAHLEDFLYRTGFPLIDGGGLRKLLSSFKGRALVNAWVLRYSRWVPRKGGFAWLYRIARGLTRLSVDELVEAYRVVRREGWRRILDYIGDG